ncbi:MAG TPA: AMP-binding protein, partial [Thermomicrobiales bacterium]
MVELLGRDTVTTGPVDQQARVNRAELTPVGFLRRSAAVFPDKTAIVHGNRGTTYTYRQFAERADRLASALRAAGLEKGDRVAYLCPNIPAVLEAYFAVPAAGGILVTINTRLNTAEIGYILDHAGARFLVVDAELYPLVAPLDLSAFHVVRIDDTGAVDDPYEVFLTTGSPEPIPHLLADEDETIAINYTSGTTGRSKGVVYSHRGAYLMALANVVEIGLTGDTVYLWTGPLFHASGWCFPWAVTAVAGTHVTLRKIDNALIWDLIDAHGVSHYHAAPTVHLGIASHPKAHRLDRPVTVVAAAAPPPPPP